jgi:HAD superfamily hydrolase (TIGR01509 family)
MIKPELIIFDCDGTLTDSEALNNQATADLLAELGYPQYDYQFCLNELVGMTMTAVKAMVEEREGVKLPDDFIQRFINMVLQRMKNGLRPVPGAVEAVDTLSAKYKTCVASNGERDNVIQSIKAIGVYGYFGEDRTFTKIQVPRGKPFPDLFLFAAQKMGIAPEKCLVIEDSLPGAQAGMAAGMQVIGITAVCHEPEVVAENMKKAGVATIFHTWAEILGHIAPL